MKKLPKILMISVFTAGFIYSVVVNIPAWMVGTFVSKYSQQRLDTANERGTFWHGQALLIAQDLDSHSAVPLIMVSWQIKLGLTKFITLSFSAANKAIATAELTKSGLQVTNLDLALSLDQVAPLLGNLNSLGLSGNVHLAAAKILLAKKNQGIINIQLEDVGSGIAPVNPLGSYQIAFDLAGQSLTVSSDSGSVLDVSGEGNLTSLVLKSRVVEDKKEKLLQFMTMMGIPQADGSYNMKVF